jgi:dTDP-4-dehydrorhamnose 3,5-epimerase
MKVIETGVPGVLIIEPRVFRDARGFFLETWHLERYAEAGLPQRFVQDNSAASSPGVLRGLHYQLRFPQGKLVRCVRGAVFDVAVDIRRGSPAFGAWVGVELSEENQRQLWIPPGFAHGYCVPERESWVAYKCTEYYHPEDEHGVMWNDRAVGIRWPLAEPLVSAKDSAYAPLSEEREDLPSV